MAEALITHADRYAGLVVNCEKQTLSTEQLLAKLKESLPLWKSEGKRGIWVKVKKEHSELVPGLIQLGFDFHHAQPGYVYLSIWLPDDIPNHLPEYANQYLGVGGFVINHKEQVLVVKENFHVQNVVSLWKLPGGLASAGEDLGATAHREVLEETGVDTEFVSVLGFRHQHNYRFGCSDFYYVCLMKALTSEIKSCPLEIADCCWMDLDVYEQHTSDINRHFVQCYRKVKSSSQCIDAQEVLAFNKKSKHKVYSIQNVMEKEGKGGSEMDGTVPGCSS